MTASRFRLPARASAADLREAVAAAGGLRPGSVVILDVEHHGNCGAPRDGECCCSPEYRIQVRPGKAP